MRVGQGQVFRIPSRFVTLMTSITDRVCHYCDCVVQDANSIRQEIYSLLSGLMLIFALKKEEKWE